MNKLHESGSERCTCGHMKREHQPSDKNGHRLCALMGCACAGFEDAPHVAAPRIPKVKTLDRPEPKLFEVEA